MIKYTQKQNYVKVTDYVPLDLASVQHFILNIESKIFSNVEKFFECSEIWMHPRIHIGREHACRTKPFSLEGERSVPGTDIQHALPVQRQRRKDRIDLCPQYAQRFIAWYHRPVGQLERVEPAVHT